MVSLFLFVLGLVIGSFLGALTYRLPREISIAKGRSFCENCKHQIRWYDNIPLLSYLILRGKCRDCHTEISLRDPLIELSSGIIFVLIGLNPVLLVISAILIAIFVTDLEFQLIFDELVFGGLAFLILTFIVTDQTKIFELLLAGFLGANILLFLNLITKGRGMGLGDVKLALLIGPMLGLEKLLTWLFFSFVSGAIIGVLLILFKGASMKQKIAFGPFLIIGFLLTLMFGNYFSKLLVI